MFCLCLKLAEFPILVQIAVETLEPSMLEVLCTYCVVGGKGSDRRARQS